ncbi:MAG: hypothetical protein KQI81_00180 [Deltaproteobacteria bacterium]|nr:hypothetical protein [Deltaproteobacteria bacterium]
MADFAGQINITRGSYVKTTAALAQFICASELWQAAVYDQKRSVISLPQTMADKTLTTGYAYGAGKPTFEHARINAGNPLNEADWKKSDASPLPTIADQFSSNPVGERFFQYHRQTVRDGYQPFLRPGGIE